MAEFDDVIRAAASAARPSTGGWHRAACPICPLVNGKSGGDSFAIRDSGVYMCWRCGSSGRVRDFEGLGGAPEPTEAAGGEVSAIEPPEGFLELGREPGASAMVTAQAREYLLGRGFDKPLWRAIGLGVVLSGYYGGRIVMPVFAEDDETWLGWVARDYTGAAERKYLYPRGMMRGSILYQHRLIREETDEPALVVEGLFDAAPYYGHALACMGKPSKWHVEALAESRRPIACVLDGDAWREAEALSLRLRLRGVRAGFVRLPPRTDPNNVYQQRGAEWLLTEARRCVA